MDVVDLEQIRAARERVGTAIYHSPCPYSLSLSRLCGAEIYCKLDHLQMTGSFKERGARNRLLRLSDAEKKVGVVAASAGNHALGLAYHGQLLGIPVTVVMPVFAPLVKVTNCRSFGATVIQHGETFADAVAEATHIAEVDGKPFISAFDHPDTINGQGTMGLEILEDVPDVDAIVVPVGGGGLLAGIGTAVKALRPKVKLYGVEPANAASLTPALAAGHPIRVDTRPTLADGLAVPATGPLCFDIIRRVVDRVVIVDEPRIAQAIVRLLEMEKTVVEGAAATPLAAVTGPLREELAGKKVVLCLCGGNIDVTLISRIIERGLATEGRLARIEVAISDRPGSLARLLKVIADAGASIKEVEHDRNFGPADVADVSISCVVETRDPNHVRMVRQAVIDAGINLRPIIDAI
jgi:threonine dehydratase